MVKHHKPKKLITIKFPLRTCNHDGKDTFCPICEDKYRQEIYKIIEEELFLKKLSEDKND